MENPAPPVPEIPTPAAPTPPVSNVEVNVSAEKGGASILVYILVAVAIGYVGYKIYQASKKKE